MKMLQIVVVFLSLFVILGGMSLPLWWNIAMPYIYEIPEYIGTILRNMYNLYDLVINSL